MFSVECKDNPTYENDCQSYKDEDYCFNKGDDYIDWMKKNCFKTCGYCDGTTTAPGGWYTTSI